MSTATSEKYEGLQTWEQPSDVPAGYVALSIPDPSGDVRIMWDPRNKDEVKTAEKAWADARGKGMVGHLVGAEDGEPGEVTREFPKKAGKVIMVQQLAGG